MDWNVFYSSLSQCAAGLIGIIAAFIISKILSENEKQEYLADKYEGLLIEYETILQKISIRNFHWCDRVEIRYSRKVQEEIEAGNFARLNDDEKLTLLYSIKPNLYRTEDCLTELNAQIEKYTPKITSLPGGISFRNNYPVIDIVPPGTWDRLNEEQEFIDQLQIESKILISKFRKFNRDLEHTNANLRPLKSTISVLGIGFLFTVIYPLHFLPIRENVVPVISFSLYNIAQQLFSVKGFFLFILGLVVLVIFGYFISVIRKLQNTISGILIDEAKMDIKSYSPYYN